MARIVKKNESISFMCDQETQCEGITLDTPEYEFMRAYHFLLRNGWKAFKGDDGVWQHACPFCYVDWCRRAGVIPYETSEHTTYDQVAVENADLHLGQTPGTVLEPQWFLDQIEKEEAERRRKRAGITLREQLDNTKRERNRRRRARKKAKRQPQYAIEDGAGYPDEDEFTYDCGPIRFSSVRRS